MTPTETAAKLQHFNDWRRGHHDDTAQPDPRDIGEAIDAAVEMIDRLEAAEKERDECNSRRLEAADHFAAQTALMKEKCDALRAKIAEMERQEPVWFIDERGEPKRYHKSKADYCKYGGLDLLYALPGAKAQNATSAPSEQDESVRKSWARFSHELHRSPDAPYPGMSDAFERHFSQSFIDREWRAEASTWAAAWKAAKSHCAQPAPSICPAALSPIINWLRNGCDPRKAADELEMLAAAPEAKA